MFWPIYFQEVKRERLPDAETKGPCSLNKSFCVPWSRPVDTTMSTNPRHIKKQLLASITRIRNTYQSSYYISFLHCEWVLIKSLKLYTFWRFQLIFPWLQRWDAIVFSKFIDWKLFQTTPRNTCNVHLKYTIPSTPHKKHNTLIDQKWRSV